MKKTTSLFVLLLFCCNLLFITSCRKSKKEFSSYADAGKSSSSGSNRITGVVKDVSGIPIQGVMITAHGQTAYTGEYGEFQLSNVSATGKIYVKADNAGYFTGTATEEISADKNTSVQIVLTPKTVVASLSSAAGGEAQDTDGNSVTLPANGVVTASGDPYTGTVDVSLLHLDPTSPEFGLLTQGADMQAENTSGTVGALYSYGVLKVELNSSDGTELQLASGSTSSVEMAIAPDQLATAPATIPLWYFDETKGIWVEEGFATKVGDKYVGTVSHFTDWNCDVFSSTQATITGTVVDCSGKPVPYIFIITGQSYAYTDENGKYTRRVPSGIEMEVRAESGYGQNFTSAASIAIPALSEGQIYDAGNLTLNECIQTIDGTLLGCYGQKIPGYVVVDNQFGGFVESGDFSIVCNAGTTVELVAYDFYWGFASVSVTTPSNASSTSVGNMTVCTETTVVGENSFVVNGGGFNNEKITLMIPPMDDINYNYYTYGEREIYLDSSGNNTLSGLYLDASGQYMGEGSYAYFGFNLNNYPTLVGVGTYLLENDYYYYNYDTSYNYTEIASGYIGIYNANSQQYDSYYPESGTLNIESFGEVGGLIEGTFSGTYKTAPVFVWDSINYTGHYEDSPNSQTLTITDGKFSVLRYPDYNYSYKMESTPLRNKVVANRKRITGRP